MTDRPVPLAHDILGADPDGGHHHLNDGPLPLVILHGLFGAARNWMSLAKQLARHRPVIIADARNHGRSPHSAVMDYRSMAGDVTALLDALDIKKAAVIGHSMGGKTAMVMALTAPDRVDRLMVADIAPVSYTGRGFEAYIDTMQSIDLSAVDRRSQVEPLLAETVEDRAVRAFLLGNVAQGQEGLEWMVNLPAIRDSLDHIYGFPDLGHASYDGPALFLSGADSNYVSADARPRIKALFPKARLASLPDAGHWLHADKPADFLAAAEVFLKA